MDALDKYLKDLRELREGVPGDVPEFSSRDGRMSARVLLLFQDPGRSGAAKTREVDRDNPDPSAAAVRETEDVLPRGLTVSWNAIPWARQGTDAAELELVRSWELVPKLLDALPDLRVVVLCGNVARLLTVDVYEYGSAARRDLLILHGPHPSSRGLNDRWFGRGARMRWLRSVFGQAHAHCHPPNNIP